MIDLPHPLDVLKFAVASVVVHCDGVGHLDHLVRDVTAAAAPFFDGERVDDLRYSDGRTVTVSSELAPGRCLYRICPPPGTSVEPT